MGRGAASKHSAHAHARGSDGDAATIPPSQHITFKALAARLLVSAAVPQPVQLAPGTEHKLQSSTQVL